jgi:hypothetical protein
MVWTQTFPPIIALSWLEVPRFLYPFDPWTFRLRIEESA